jgi:hypothetical protein
LRYGGEDDEIDTLADNEGNLSKRFFNHFESSLSLLALMPGTQLRRCKKMPDSS